MLAPSANKFLAETLQELHINQNEINALIGCYNANHRDDEITITNFRDIAFITESGHDALKIFIENELFTLAEAERQTGITVDKLQHMIDVCRERGDIPADAYLPAFPLNSELVIHKSYIDTMQDRYLTFTEYLDNNPEEVLEEDEQDENRPAYDEEPEEETPAEDEEPHVDEVVVATSPDIDDSDLQKKLKKQQQLKEKQKRDDIIAKEKERQQRDAENGKKDDARLGFEKKREEDYRREELRREEELRKERERLAHQEKVKGAMGSAYDEKKTETTVSAATFGYSSDEHEKIKEDIRREQDATLARANEEAERLERLNKEQQRREEHKPADTYKAPETPKYSDPYKKPEYKSYEETKNEGYRPETRQPERNDGARNDAEKHYDTPKYDEPKKEEYKPYTPTTSFVKDEYKPSEIAKDTYKPSEYKPSYEEKKPYSPFSEYVKVETAKDNFATQLTPSQIERIEKGDYKDTYVPKTEEYKPSYREEYKPYSPETYRPVYEPYKPVTSTAPKHEEPKKTETHYQEPKREDYRHEDGYKKTEYTHTPVSPVRDDYKPSSGSGDSFHKEPEKHTPGDYRVSDDYRKDNYRHETTKTEEHRPFYKEETPKTDTRNPYENKHSSNESEYRNYEHREEKKPDYTPKQNDENVRQPERTDGARNNSQRYGEKQPETKQPDTRNPYENKTSFGEKIEKPVEHEPIKGDAQTGYAHAQGGSEKKEPVSGDAQRPVETTIPRREYKPDDRTPTDVFGEKKDGYTPVVTTIPNVVKNGVPEERKPVSGGFANTSSIENKKEEPKIDTRNPYENKHSSNESEYRNATSFTEKGEFKIQSTEKGTFTAPIVKNHGVVEKSTPVTSTVSDRREERYNPVADVKVEKVYYETIAGRKVAVPESQLQRFTELKDLADNFKPKTAEQIKEIRSFETYTGTNQIGNREDHGVAITMNGRTFVSDTANISDAEKIRNAIATGAVVDEGLKQNISYFKNLDVDTVRARAEETKKRNEEMVKGRHDALDDEAIRHGGVEKYHDKIRDDGRKDARDDLAVHHGGTEKLADKIREDGRKEAKDDHPEFNIARDKLTEKREGLSFNENTGSKVIGDADSLRKEVMHTDTFFGGKNDASTKIPGGILLNGKRVENADGFAIPDNGFVEDAKTGAIFATIGQHTYRMEKADYKSFMEIKGRAKNGIVDDNDLKTLNSFTSLTSHGDIVSLIKGKKGFDTVEASIGSIEKGPRSLKDAYGPDAKTDNTLANRRFIDGAAALVAAPIMNTTAMRSIQKVTGTVQTVTYLIGVDSYRFKRDFDTYRVKLLKTANTTDFSTSPQSIAFASMKNSLTQNATLLNRMLQENETTENLLDVTFGLELVKNPKRLNANGLKEFLEANKIENLGDLTGDKIRVLARNVQNNDLKNHLLKEAKLNDYLRKNKINLASLSEEEIAILIHNTNNLEIRDLLKNRTQIGGFKGGLNINDKVLSNRAIAENKKKMLNILSNGNERIKATYGRLSIRQLQDLLNSAEFINDPIKRQALATLIQTKMFETGGFQKLKFSDRIYKAIMSFESEAQSDDSFAGMRDAKQIGRVALQAASVPRSIVDMTKAKMAKYEKKLAQRYERRAINAKTPEKAIDFRDKAEKHIKKYDNLSERRTTYKERLKEKMDDVAKKGVDKFRKTKLGTKLANLGERYKGSYLGKALGALGKGVKAVGEVAQFIAKLLAKVAHYIAIAVLVLLGAVLAIELILLLIGFGGKIMVGFWDSLFGTEIGSERLVAVLAEMQEEDERLFDWIDDKIELNDLNLSSWETPEAFGFLNPYISTSERSQITVADHVEQLYWSGNTEKVNPVSGTLGVTTISRYSNAQDILSVNYAAFDGSLDILELWTKKDQKYCKKLWNNTHMCYVCKSQYVDEGFLGTDDTNFHAHTVNLTTCGTGDGTYTYYCDTTNNTKTSSSAHKGTFWVYNAKIFTNQVINPETSKNSSVYLAVVDGDMNEWGVQGGKLYGKDFGNNHSGAGCINFDCSTSKFVAKSITYRNLSFSKDSSGNKVGYRMPTYSNGSECDNHTALSYCNSYYCTNKYKIKHSANTLYDCNNKYYHANTDCDNASETQVPTTWCEYEEEIVYVKGYMYLNGKKYDVKVPVTRDKCPDDCDNYVEGEEITEIEKDGRKIYLYDRIYHDKCEGHDFVTEYACNGHCRGHEVCGGHMECNGHYRCDGHTMSYCSGHVTVSVQVQQYGVYDKEMFSKKVQESEEDMNKKQKDFARSVYEQDWESTYGIIFLNEDNPYGKMGEAKKAELIADASSAGIGENPLKIFALATDSIGRIPYYGQLKEYYDHLGQPGYGNGYMRMDDDNFFYQFTQIAVTPHGNLADDMGNCYMGLDELGYVNMMLYQLGYTNSFSPTAFYLSAGWQKISGTSGLQPGDVVQYKLGGNGEYHYGFYVGTVGNQHKIIAMDKGAGNVIVKTIALNPSYTTAYRKY